MDNIDYFHRELDHHPCIKKIPNYPVTAITMPRLDELAKKKNILISAFPYPAPHSPKIKRVVINALHTQEDLHQIIQLIKENL
jgi:7-keto-8-aminopelargonate synthetase-like enzyme